MFVVSFRNVCLCLFLHLVTGKSLDLQYGYQEIEDSDSQKNQEEIQILEFDRISDAIEKICKNLKVMIHIKNSESFINCLETVFDRSRSVRLVKREAEELEGSGDIDVTVSSNTADQNSEGSTDVVQTSESSSEPNAEVPSENQSTLVQQVSSENPQTTTDKVATVSENAADQNSERLTDAQQNSGTNASAPNVVETPEIHSKSAEQIVVLSEKSETPTGDPGSFQSGFDNILKNIPRQSSNGTKDIENTNEILKTSATNSQINVKPEVPPSDGEEAKTGESQEQPTGASSNNMLLLVIAGLGVIGALAFAYNFVKRRRETREIDEAVRLEMEGKELKEMKPLMKSPLVQNGAKSMEYIDADPQIEIPTETRVEVNRDHSSE